MMTNLDKIQLTKEGFARIKKEYQHLIGFKRPQIVERLTEARREGDLSENNEYIQLRQELSFIDGRIAELNGVVDKAVVVENDHDKCHQVVLGCQVTVQNGNGQNQVFHLVGEWEADPAAQKISFESPLGKSLLGKKIGEQVEVEAPAGKIVYTVKSIV